MAQAAATKFDATINKVEIIESNKLKRAEVWGESDKAVHWAGAFAVYGGHGATASSTIVYEIEPGKPMPPRKRNTSSRAPASSILKTDPRILSGLAAS